SHTNISRQHWNQPSDEVFFSRSAAIHARAYYVDSHLLLYHVHEKHSLKAEMFGFDKPRSEYKFNAHKLRNREKQCYSNYMMLVISYYRRFIYHFDGGMLARQQIRDDGTQDLKNGASEGRRR
ncbi:unnamed protein product, partial [Laminaria digitata]